MRAVQTTVTAAPNAESAPKNAQMPPMLPNTIQPSAKRSAGAKVATDATPSRESHELRHSEKARQARSGCPRCSVEESKPAVIAPSESVSEAAARPRSAGSPPATAQRPSQAKSP